jgi:hypothetical protein
LIRAMMRVVSNTLPIWLTRRAWKLLVHPLVIVVLLSWWRVEGLLILHLHLFYLLLLVVVVLMSVVRKLCLDPLLGL